MPKLSDTASSILTLLNNANELIVKSSDRQGARDVMKALDVYAKSKRFILPEDLMKNWFAVLLDARPYTLTMIVKDIAENVIKIDGKNRHTKMQKTE